MSKALSQRDLSSILKLKIILKEGGERCSDTSLCWEGIESRQFHTLESGAHGDKDTECCPLPCWVQENRDESKALEKMILSTQVRC